MDSREILYSILSDTEDLFYRTDKNGVLIWVSPSAAIMLNYNSIEELLGKNFTDEFFTDPGQSRFFLEELQDKGRITDFQVEMRRSDGTTITVSTDSHCYRDRDGNIAGIEGICRDITGRKKVEESLLQSERKYHALIENTPGVTWSSDRRGNTTFISPNVVDVYGYTPEEIYESGDDLWLKRIHPEDIESVKNNYDNLFCKGGQFDIEYRIQRKDGQWIWLHDRAAMTYEKNGVAYAYGMFSDITGQKQAEEALRESEERWRGISENSPDIILTLDQDFNIQFINRTITGHKEDVIGKSVFHFVPEKIALELMECFERVLKTGKPGSYETEYIDDNGSYRYFECRVGSMVNARGATTLILCATDATEKKLAERKIQESEDKYRGLIDALQEGIWAIDEHDNTTFVNNRMAEMLGYTVEEMLGEKVSSFMDEHGVALCKYYVERRKEGVKEQHDFELIRKDGRRIYVTMEASPIYDESGNYAGGVTGVVDVTERKNAEEIILNVAKGVSATTGEKFFYSLAEYLSKILEADYSYIAEVVKGKPNYVRTLSLIADGRVIDNIEVDLTGTPCETVFKQKTAAYPSDIQSLFPRAFMMKQMNVEGYFGTVLSEASGADSGLMAVMYRKPVKNIAVVESALRIFASRASAELERRHAEEALKKAKEEIEEWNKELEKRVEQKTEDLEKSQARLIQSEKLTAMGRLAAGLAHELNSPLAGLLPLLEKYKGQAQAGTREYREMVMMCKAAEHMARIIRDFGAFSRMREGVFEKLSLNDIIEDTLSFSASQLKKNGIRIIKEYTENLPEILGDKTELQQVVLNMITNIRDAIDCGGEVILKTGVSEDNKVIMEFIDNGGGIEKDNLNKIFDPFFTTKKTGEGVGLGLSLSYGIIKKHKGEIVVESEPGKGTRFTVAFPLST